MCHARCTGAQVDGYEHFRSGRCVLFEVADIEQWQLDWNRQVERCVASCCITLISGLSVETGPLHNPS